MIIETILAAIIGIFVLFILRIAIEALRNDFFRSITLYAATALVIWAGLLVTE